MDLMGGKNPWAETSCGEPDCMVCTSKSKKPGSTTQCRLESICYVLGCDRCQEQGVAAQYWGESSRTSFPPRTGAPTSPGEESR